MFFSELSLLISAMNNLSRKLIAGNWKMNMLRQDAQALTAEIIGMLDDEEPRGVRVVLFPAFIHIGLLVSQTQGSSVLIGAQDCSVHNNGAYTGEVSAAMIANAGAKYIITGHSERRQYHHESSAFIAKKVIASLHENLTPIYCCGEIFEDRESGNYQIIVEQQIKEGLFHLSKEDVRKCIIAYEPVWAIGTGKTATAQQAQDMHAFIRNLIAEKYDSNTATNFTILYGGSCNENNAHELFSMPDVDGGLIGGASLKSRSFVNIVKAMS